MKALGDVAIMGGGCYGSFYLTQLLLARDRGAIAFERLLVVDHAVNCQARASLGPQCELVVETWDAFLDRHLEQPADPAKLPGMIVPTPLMPHLMAQWLLRQARRTWPDRQVSLVPPEQAFGTPYDRLHTDNVRYVSHADWICPTHCVEPLLCPAIRAPRTWEMGDTVRTWSNAHRRDRATAEPAFFTCRHEAFGVGMFPVMAAHDALSALKQAATDRTAVDQVIGSISACHGAVALLRIE